jgi:hypothetical protein
LIVPPKGSTSQSFSVPCAMGTTSWCAISMMGLALGSDPGQV